MRQRQVETAANLLRDYDPKRSVVFGSLSDTLVTHGIFARLSAPAVGASAPTSRIQQDAKRLLADARAAGIKDPIIVGSIPFDVTKSSALIVPERYRFAVQADSNPFAQPSPGATSVRHEGREAFQEAVRELLGLIQGGTLRKVVLSRTLDVDLEGDLDVHALMAHLMTTSPTGYRYSVPVRDGETLVGVSPELLLRKRGQRIFSNPLAGSVPRSRFASERAAATFLQESAKDLVEHRFVVEQVREVLKRYCPQLSAPPSPSLLSTAFLWHLSTWIEGTLARDATEGVNALSLAAALHPTPAVCGYPPQLARETIERIESYDRDLFTGMTGWMDEHGDGEWVVTIRCGLLRPSSAKLFAGAGIVTGSAPELEWEETVAKMGPMLHALTIAQSQPHASVS